MTSVELEMYSRKFIFACLNTSLAATALVLASSTFSHSISKLSTYTFLKSTASCSGPNLARRARITAANINGDETTPKATRQNR
ncbi:unnamed protein product [Meloidogyne enterolobii]|uniref:Uncharacterized protein n=1 Tax=Meloidogyne enterolobii TaxID=390850 RepID=A0ACB0ZCQ1_MELEN